MTATGKRTSTSLSKYLPMLDRLGFQPVTEVPFTMPGDRNEMYYVFWQPTDGILLAFDTFLGSQVRAGTFYFNWRRRISQGWIYRLKRPLLTNGFWSAEGKRDVFVGSGHVPGHDIGQVITRFKRCGTFVCPWVEAPHVNLENVGDVVMNKNVHLLPPFVRDALEL